MLRMVSWRIEPGGTSWAFGAPGSSSLWRKLPHRKGCPSPAQNQSNRLQLIVRSESVTLLIEPPSAVRRTTPRLTLLNRQWLTLMLRTPARLPSANLIPAEAEERRQLVTQIFSQGRAGPHRLPDTKATQSSPVSMAHLATLTSWQPSRSMPSAQTPACILV